MSDDNIKRFLPLDEDDCPALEADFFANATYRHGDEIIHPGTGPISRTPRGRPPQGTASKVQQSLRLSPEVLDWFRATGDGWQGRIDEVLRAYVAEQIGRKAA